MDDLHHAVQQIPFKYGPTQNIGMITGGGGVRSFVGMLWTAVAKILAPWINMDTTPATNTWLG